MHIVLLGDSIFDNVAYTRGEPDVVAQLRELLPRKWRASLLALDGSTTVTCLRQLERIPADASHLVLSVGGNDALWKAEILGAPARSMSDALMELGELSREFDGKYREAVNGCLKLRLPVTVCTIYEGSFPDELYQRLASTALVHFNDVILRVAAEYSLSVIDLRFVCSSPEDYANPIEPSSIGGAKIARAVINAVCPDSSVNRAARICVG